MGFSDLRPVWVQLGPVHVLMWETCKLYLGYVCYWDNTTLLYIYRRITADWESNFNFNHQKTNLLPFFVYTNFSNPCCLTCLSMRFGGVLGGLANPMTSSMCPSPTGLPERCSRGLQVKNDSILALSTHGWYCWFWGYTHYMIGHVLPWAC